MSRINKKLTAEEIKSGYVVRLRDNSLWLVIRAGRFTKILVHGDTWHYLSSWDPDTLKSKKHIRPHPLSPITVPASSLDIVEVYGLVESSAHYHQATSTLLNHRELIWTRTPTVKMTVAEICEKLGYDIEIVKEN